MNLVGPVFWKELIEASRRKRYLLLRCIVPFLFLFLVFIIGVEEGSRRSWSNDTIVQRQNRAGRAFFDCWAVLVTMTVGIAAPLLMGGLIAAEREKGSLDLLFTTDLSSREIVLGKVASRIAVLWLLMFGTAPVLLIIRFLGGVSSELVFGILLITLSGAAFISSVGLYYSAVTKRPWIAIVRTYFFFGLWWFLLPLCFVAGVATWMHVFNSTGMNRFPTELNWIVVLNLPISLIAQVEPRNPFGVSSLEFAIWDSIVSWLASAFFLFLTHRRLRESPSSGGSTWFFAPFRWLLGAGRWVAAPFLHGLAAVVPSSVVKRVRIPEARMEQMLDRQPVAWRNLKASVFDPDRYLSRIQRFLAFVLFAFLSIGTLSFGPTSSRDFVAFTLMTTVVLQFILVVLAAGSISRERERGSLDLLRMTLLVPNQIVFGNLIGAFRAVKAVMWAFVALGCYAVFFQVFTISFTIQYAAVLGIGTLFVATQALLISAAAPNTTTAMAAAIAVGFLWWVGPLFYEEREIRSWVVGLSATLAPMAFLPMNRRPHWAAVAIAAASSLTLFGLLGAYRFTDAVLPAIVCSIITLLSIGWMRAPFALPRFIAACVCCIHLPLAVGMTACTVFNVDLRSLEHVLLFPKFIVEVESSQYYGPGEFIRRGSSGWVNSHSDWAATLFFCSTLLSTIFLYRVTLRAFPKLTAST